jgi:hypothetical protein
MTYSYGGMLALYINSNWKLVQRMVDFMVLSEREHEGVYAAVGFVKKAKARGGLNKISVIF